MQNLESRSKSPAPLDLAGSACQFQIKDFNEIVGKDAGALEQLIALYNYKIFWTYALNCILGLWLISSPFLFDYKSSALVISDTVSGALIILFELLSFSPRLALLRWGTAAIAFWLLLAPLVFWSPTPAVYLIDTLIGGSVIAFSILVPADGQEQNCLVPISL